MAITTTTRRRDVTGDRGHRRSVGRRGRSSWRPGASGPIGPHRVRSANRRVPRGGAEPRELDAFLKAAVRGHPATRAAAGARTPGNGGLGGAQYLGGQRWQVKAARRAVRTTVENTC